MTLYGLNNAVIEEIKKIFTHYPQIEKAILYGSRAMGNFKKGSDIDMCLSGSDLNFETLLRLSSDLDETDLPYTFDISLYDHIENNDLLKHIERVGIVFYSKGQ